MRTAPLPGLRNVERYAEWVEACEYDSERRAAGPWWWLLFLEAIGKVVCEAIVEELDNRWSPVCLRPVQNTTR